MEWLWKVALKKSVSKAIYAGVGAGFAFLVANSGVLSPIGIKVVESSNGIFFIEVNTLILVPFLVGALELLRNRLKHKNGVKWL